MGARRVALAAVCVVVSAAVGVALGRVSVPSCTERRDEHAVVAREIRTQAERSVDAIDPESVDRAHAIVTSRSDCFSTTEIEQVERLNELHGSDA